MEAEKLFCKIGVRFVNKNGLSQKTYNYLITKDWINSKKNNPFDIAKLTNCASVFIIMTENGYGAEVIIVNVDRCEGNYSPEWEDLKVIKDLIYTRSDSSLSFNSNTFKEEDFYGEGNNLLVNQFFNTCSNNTIDTPKVEGICNCTSKTATSYTDKINYNPYITTTTGTISISSDGITYNGIDLTSKINEFQKEIDKLKTKESEENKMFNF